MWTQDRSRAILGRAALVAVMTVAGVATTTVAAVPANDDRAAATPVAELPFRDALDTADATAQDNDPTDCFDPSPTVWYAFTSTADERVFATTRGSDYDTTLTLAIRGPDGLEIVACNDDFDDLTSLIGWRAAAGTDYLLMVGSFDGEGGSLDFAIRRAPARPSFELRIARSSTLNRHGAAVVRGTLRCQGTRRGQWVDVMGRQDVGRLRIRGFGDGPARCGRRWAIRVRSPFFRFESGALVVRATMGWCTAFHCGVERARRVVRIR